eukprot:5962844-Amphidinium_carterae.1
MRVRIYDISDHHAARCSFQSDLASLGATQVWKTNGFANSGVDNLHAEDSRMGAPAARVSGTTAHLSDVLCTTGICIELPHKPLSV